MRINRLILLLSLAGMILALHLWIQKARGFDQGCLGLNTHPSRATGGCQEVSDLPASHLFGVSNAAWGYAFYFGLAVIAFARPLATPRQSRWLRWLGEGGVTVALLYSGYLVYTMVVTAHLLCVLCLASSALVGVLFGLHVWQRRRGVDAPPAGEARVTEIGWSAGAVFLASGALVATVLFVNRLGTRPLGQGQTAREFEQLVGSSLPAFIAQEKLDAMRPCQFERQAPSLDFKKFRGFGLPVIGNPDGVPITVFYDPNCGHCATVHTEILRLIERFKGRAGFVLVPRSLWERSLIAGDALLLATTPEHALELWRGLFEQSLATRGYISADDTLRCLQQAGLAGDTLASRLSAARPATLALRAASVAANIGSVPAVFVRGKRVAEVSTQENCIATLIERELAAR